MTNLGTSAVLRFFATILILLTGLVHLVIIPEHFRIEPWVGVAFAVNFLGALLAGAWILQDIWIGWIVGLLVAAGAFAAYVVSRAVGLPNFNEAVGQWFTRAGTFSLIVEALFVVLFLIALAQGARR